MTENVGYNYTISEVIDKMVVVAYQVYASILTFYRTFSEHLPKCRARTRRRTEGIRQGHNILHILGDSVHPIGGTSRTRQRKRDQRLQAATGTYVASISPTLGGKRPTCVPPKSSEMSVIYGT